MDRGSSKTIPSKQRHEDTDDGAVAWHIPFKTKQPQREISSSLKAIRGIISSSLFSVEFGTWTSGFWTSFSWSFIRSICISSCLLDDSQFPHTPRIYGHLEQINWVSLGHLQHAFQRHHCRCRIYPEGIPRVGLETKWFFTNPKSQAGGCLCRYCRSRCVISKSLFQ